MKEIVLGPIGHTAILILRALLGSVFICGGIQFLGIQKLPRFFTLKKILSVFLLSLGARLILDVVFFFKIV